MNINMSKDQAFIAENVDNDNNSILYKNKKRILQSSLWNFKSVCTVLTRVAIVFILDKLNRINLTANIVYKTKTCVLSLWIL